MARRSRLNKSAHSGALERPVRFRKYKYLFLIVCEDQRTEPTYFEKFRAQLPENTVFLLPVGTGRDAKGVVEEAILEKARLATNAKKEVDCVWVVFDKDSADENATKILRFNEAFRIANENGFKIAYSNEAFELWLLLHLMNVDANTPLPRSKINEALQSRINRNHRFASFIYTHGKIEILDVISKIGNESKAIARAEALNAKHKGIDPINANPNTTVGILVSELLDLIKFYS